jgi:hypothetical protein
MIALPRARFERFVERKTREAAAARIEPLATIVDRHDDTRLLAVGNSWTRRHYGSDFGLVVAHRDETAMSLAMVCGSDGADTRRGHEESVARRRRRHRVRARPHHLIRCTGVPR